MMTPMRTIPYAGVVIVMFIAGIFICGLTASDVVAGLYTLMVLHLSRVLIRKFSPSD